MKITRYSLLITLAIVLSACPGGGGGGNTTPSDTENKDTTNNDTVPPAISGFDFNLQKGDFWEYGWDYKRSYTSAYSSSSSSYKSKFRITLGNPIISDGITFYEMLISGNTKAGEYSDLAPKGKYLAVSGNRIITLAADGTTQNFVFDAQAGSWPGSGFFASFPSDTLFEATLSSISNDYINSTAYQVKESASSSQCEYFPGIGTICGGDYNENLDEREYYAEGMGAVGSYAYFSMSDWSSPDGGWSSSNTTNIGLTASSLRGDTVDYILEVEPNNQISEATPITLPARVKGDGVSEAFLGGTTAVSIGSISLFEAEPNDSPFAPQTVEVSSTITGDALEGDANTSVSVQTAPSGGTTYTATFEDWYEVTTANGKTLNVDLNFSGTGADLDMYLFSLEGSNTVITHANSIEDNAGTGNYTEHMNKYLAAGTYYVAVDAFSTPSGRAGYTLNISTEDSLIDIADWFSFALSSEAVVTIKVTGGPSFVLTDATGGSTLASGGASGASVALTAGTYLVGVSEGTAYTLEAYQ